VEKVCTKHYVDEAMRHLETAAALCRQGHTIQSSELDRLRAQADFAVRRLAGDCEQDGNHEKERLLQFVLGLANLHQFLSQHLSLVGKSH
jgi:hypothetical protein